MIVAGIDPGFSGAVAVINDHGDCDTCEMPVIGDGTQKMVNVSRVAAFLTERDVEFAIVEEVTAMRGWGVGATFRFGGAYYSILAALQLSCIPYLTVRPGRWKKALGLPRDKLVSRRRATELFPRAYQQFERVKDEGRAEAALIAWWHLHVSVAQRESEAG